MYSFVFLLLSSCSFSLSLAHNIFPRVASPWANSSSTLVSVISTTSTSAVESHASPDLTSSFTTSITSQISTISVTHAFVDSSKSFLSTNSSTSSLGTSGSIPLTTSSQRTVAFVSTNSYLTNSTGSPSLYQTPSATNSANVSHGPALSSPAPSSSSNSSACPVNCRNVYPRITTWVWTTTKIPLVSPVQFGGTAIVEFNEQTNKTATTTLVDPQVLDGPMATLTYPNPYTDYDNIYTISSATRRQPLAIPTNGKCLRNSAATSFTLPSHPLLPQATGAPFTLAENTTYAIVAIAGPLGEDPADFFNASFPHEAAFNLCEPPVIQSQLSSAPGTGPGAVTSVLLLTTITKTSTAAKSATVDQFTTVVPTSTPSATISTTMPPTTTSTIQQLSAPSQSQGQGEPTAASPAPGRTIASSIMVTGTTSNGIDATSASSTQESQPIDLPTSIQTFALGTNTVTVVNPPPTDLASTLTSSAPGFVVSGTSHSLGETFTVASTPVVVITSSSGTFVVVGNGPTASTVPLLSPTTQISVSLNSNFPPPPTPPVLVAGSQTLTIGGSITLGAGPSQTVASLLVDGSGDTILVAGGQTSTLGGPLNSQGSNRPTSVIPFGGVTFTQLSLPQVTTNSAGETIVVSNGVTATLTAPLTLFQSSPLAAITIGGTIVSPTTLTSSGGQAFVVSGHTLSLGGSITIGEGATSTILSLTTDTTGQTVLVSNGQTSVLAKPPTPVTPVALTIDGTTISATSLSSGGQGFVVNSQILTLGGSATITQSGTKTVLTLTTDGGGKTVLVSNGQTSTIPGQNTVPTGAVLTLDGTTVTAIPLQSGGSAFVIGGQTLTVGGSVTVNLGGTSTIFSLTTDASGRTVLVSNGHTSTVTNQPISSSAGLLTIDGTTYTAISLPTGGIGYVVAGQTLTIGASAIVTHGSSSTIYTLTTDQNGHTILVSNGMTSTVPDDPTIATTMVPPRSTPLSTPRQTSTTKSAAARIRLGSVCSPTILIFSFTTIFVSFLVY